MRALLCRAYGPPEQLEVAEVASLTPARGQVVIDVKACGVNFPDTLIIQGKYQFQPAMPFAPGSDVAGIVSAIGDQVTGVAVGDRVAATTGWGGFADQVTCDARALISISDTVDFVTAASYQMVYGTAAHALLDRATMQPSETLLVLGAAGGVGMAAVQIGKILGARIIAAASTDAKLAACQAAGADAGINYATEDLRERLKALTQGNGVDVVFDPVGGPYAEPAVRSMAWKGRYLVVGFAAGEIPRIPLNLLLLKGCSLVGVFWGSFAQREPAQNQAHLREVMQWIAEGTLQPHISGTYSLAEAPRAIRDLMERRVIGKAVIVMEG